MRSQTDTLPNQSVHSQPAHSEKSISREGVAKQSGGAEVMPSPQVMSLAGPSRTTPVVKSSLMPYAILALLLIVVIWFVIRKWWNSRKKVIPSILLTRTIFYHLQVFLTLGCIIRGWKFKNRN